MVFVALLANFNHFSVFFSYYKIQPYHSILFFNFPLNLVELLYNIKKNIFYFSKVFMN
jgi:hypothetical protein